VPPADAVNDSQPQPQPEPQPQPADLRAELERLHASAFVWALSCCRRQRAEAEDALQSSYLKVLDGRARFTGGSSFKTFLFGVIRRTAAEQRRSRLLARLRLARWVPGRPAAPDDPERDAALSLDARRLARALRTLPPRQRQLLELVFVHELTVEEASLALGISAGAGRVHYHRGKTRLRRLCDE
jgi:RNA polymerase sigma factor (sigma-70 family)